MPPAENDIRVLIPRVRRAIDGPAASSSASPSSSLSDEQLTAVIADAIASVIFWSEGNFPHTLNVEARDENYGAPTQWTVDPVLTESEATVVAAQAALDYFFWSIKDLKTSETIRDEGQEWQYSLSATLIRDQINYLRSLRDKALEQIAASAAPMDAYASFVAVREAEVSALIEPWVRVA